MSSAQIDSSCLQHAGSMSTYIVLTNCKLCQAVTAVTPRQTAIVWWQVASQQPQLFFLWYRNSANLCMYFAMDVIQRGFETLQACFHKVLQNPNCTLLDADDAVYAVECWLLDKWARTGKKPTAEITRKGRSLKKWRLCIVFNTQFHFSSLYVTTLLSTQPPRKTNNEMSSSTQTSFTTYFMHSLHPQMFSPFIGAVHGLPTCYH